MARSEDDIRNAIRNITRGTAYKNWEIGLTNDPDRRFAEKGIDSDDASIFRANTPGVAQRIESDLLNKGMKGGSGGVRDDSLYIYLVPK